MDLYKVVCNDLLVEEEENDVPPLNESDISSNKSAQVQLEGDKEDEERTFEEDYVHFKAISKLRRVS